MTHWRTAVNNPIKKPLTPVASMNMVSGMFRLIANQSMPMQPAAMLIRMAC